MALTIKVDKTTFGFDSTKTEKFVTRALRNATISHKDMLEQIAKESSVNEGDVYKVVNALISAMCTYMKQGHGVNLGDFGIFRPAISAKSTSDVEKAGTGSIRKKKITFTPGKKLREFISGLEVTNISSLSAFSGEDSSGPSTDSGGDGDGGGTDTEQPGGGNEGGGELG